MENDNQPKFSNFSDLVTQWKSGSAENTEINESSDAMDLVNEGIEDSPVVEKYYSEEIPAESATELSIQADSSTTDSKSVTSEDIEELFVKGADGRKQKVKIDYTDRKAIKKAVMEAAGMRKFQAERDANSKLLRPLEQALNAPVTAKAVEELLEIRKGFQDLETVFDKQGAKGLIEKLGGDGAWQKAVDAELEHREYVNNLSAEEKYRMELDNRDKMYRQQLDEEKSKRESFEKVIQEKEERASLSALESRLHPAFERYRFAGKLGDPSVENFYDEAIWSKVQARLAEYPDTMDLSQAIIDKEFRTVANMFTKYVKQETEKKVKETVEKKKTDTMKRAQVAAKKGLTGTDTRKDILEKLTKGNLSDALSLWRQNK